MPTARQIYENRLMTLCRLSEGDRLVWQERDGECVPETVWWENRPQVARPAPWLSTWHWLRRRELVAQGFAPKDSPYNGMRHKVFVLTPAGLDAFLDLEPPLAC